MLLQRSGIGPAKLLRDLDLPCVVDNRFVGENLMDHPGSQILVAPREASVCDPALPAYQLGIRWSSEGGSANDMLIGLMNYWDTAYDPALRAAAGMDHVFAVTCGLHEPFSRGSIRLRSADPAVAPEIDFDMLSDRRDEMRLLEGLRMLRALLRTEPMRAFADRMLLIDDAAFADDEALGRYLRSSITAWYHASGTCRMGLDAAAGAVVDQSLRVHGVDRLFVADASIIPVIPKAPTNLTVIAIAERAADILRGREGGVAQ
jgi:choline dehydrogenase